MSKKETKRFTITIAPEIEQKLNEGNYNCSELPTHTRGDGWVLRSIL